MQASKKKKQRMAAMNVPAMCGISLEYILPRHITSSMSQCTAKLGAAGNEEYAESERKAEEEQKTT
jgi:hypothetical protein